MNNNEMLAVRQLIAAAENDKLSRNLRQAINIINAEYQQIDWEDQAFLNRILNEALTVFENSEVKYGVN